MLESELRAAIGRVWASGSRSFRIIGSIGIASTLVISAAGDEPAVQIKSAAGAINAFASTTLPGRPGQEWSTDDFDGSGVWIGAVDAVTSQSASAMSVASRIDPDFICGSMQLSAESFGESGGRFEFPIADAQTYGFIFVQFDVSRPTPMRLRVESYTQSGSGSWFVLAAPFIRYQGPVSDWEFFSTQWNVFEMDDFAETLVPGTHELEFYAIVDSAGGPESPVVPWTHEMDYFIVFGTPSPDLNGDGSVDGADLGMLLAAWGPCPTCPEPCHADLNFDGLVDGADLGLMLGAWGD